MNLKFPSFYRWDGGILPDKWSFGYLTGYDEDLICITPNIRDKMEAEIVLSPVCHTRLYAVSAFILKRILLRIDENMGIRRLNYDNPSKESGVYHAHPTLSRVR